MIRPACLALACVLAGPAAGTGGSGLPSGQTVELYEVLVDHVGAEHWIRFRFLAPQIARDTGQLGFAEVEPDMTYLCATVALPYLDEFDLAGEVVVISLADRAVDFGQSDPDATQYIDAFRVENGICIWEGY